MVEPPQATETLSTYTPSFLPLPSDTRWNRSRNAEPSVPADAELWRTKDPLVVAPPGPPKVSATLQAPGDVAGAVSAVNRSFGERRARSSYASLQLVCPCGSIVVDD